MNTAMPPSQPLNSEDQTRQASQHWLSTTTDPLLTEIQVEDLTNGVLALVFATGVAKANTSINYHS